jgi:hypothetical protein
LTLRFPPSQIAVDASRVIRKVTFSGARTTALADDSTDVDRSGIGSVLKNALKSAASI